MREAWLWASETMRQSGPLSAVTAARLAAYPEERTSPDSRPVSSASAASASRWACVVPVTSREARAEVPSAVIASRAAVRTRGWSARPR